jgi:hypothetical protein
MVAVAEKPTGVVAAQEQSRAGYIAAVSEGKVIYDDVTLANALAERIKELQKCEGYACDSKVGYMTTVTKNKNTHQKVLRGMPGAEVPIPDKLGQQKTITINFSRMQDAHGQAGPISDNKLHVRLLALQKFLVENAEKPEGQQEKIRVVFYGTLAPNSLAAQVFADIARDKRGLLRGAAYQQTGFSGVDLSEVDLRYGSFLGGNLQEANVRGANFSGAEMRGTNLREVNGRPTDEDKITYFYGAKLTNADCTRANLPQADFTLAEIAGTNFSFANLTNACFKLMDKAQWKLANFKGAVTSGWQLSWNQSNKRAKELQRKAGGSGGILETVLAFFPHFSRAGR